MDTVILSLGGSIICPERVDTAYIKKFRDFILNYDKRFIIICGGGKICREYQDAAREIAGITDTASDWIGIASTRLNAELVRAVFGDYAYNRVYGDPEEYIDTDKKIIIGAGYLPGHSSDMDAVLLAKTFGAKVVVNLSNIDQAYTDDPKKNPGAKPIDKITWDEFQDIVGTEWVPGKSAPFDPMASMKAKELGLKIIIMNGHDLDNLSSCIDGGEYKGSTIE